MLINDRKGKTKGIRGVTINIYEQESRPLRSKSLTVHGYDIEEVWTKINFLFRALSYGKKIVIQVEKED